MKKLISILILIAFVAGIPILNDSCNKVDESVDETENYTIWYCTGTTLLGKYEQKYSHLQQISKNQTLLLKIEEPDEHSPNECRFYYDSLDRLISVEEDIRYLNLVKIHFFYDGTSENVTVIKTGDDVITNCGYNEQGLLMKKIHYVIQDGDTNLSGSTEYFYNDTSRQPFKSESFSKHQNEESFKEEYYFYDGMNHPLKHSAVQWRYFCYTPFSYPIHINENVIRHFIVSQNDTTSIDYSFDYDKYGYPSYSMSFNHFYQYDGF